MLVEDCCAVPFGDREEVRSNLMAIGVRACALDEESEPGFVDGRML